MSIMMKILKINEYNDKDLKGQNHKEYNAIITGKKNFYHKFIDLKLRT